MGAAIVVRSDDKYGDSEPHAPGGKERNRKGTGHGHNQRDGV